MSDLDCGNATGQWRRRSVVAPRSFAVQPLAARSCGRGRQEAADHGCILERRASAGTRRLSLGCTQMDECSAGRARIVWRHQGSDISAGACQESYAGKHINRLWYYQNNTNSTSPVCHLKLGVRLFVA